MLHRAAQVKPGRTVLIFGANGGVGGILIQLAQHHGVTVIGAASPRHHDALRAARVVPVDYADPNLPAVVRRHAPAGVDAVFDNIAARFPLTEAAAALELAESRTLNGKVIL